MKQNTFGDKKDGMLKKHRQKKFWKKVIAMLSCVTVFCTSYTMILPAMTMSETTYCGQEEGENHTHTLQCYSNPNADLETEANWTATIPALTGNWNEDVVAVANSQLGYHESTANYQVSDNNEKKGYTRYGAWMNDPYADWNTDFVLFCLHYANVDTNSLSLSNDISSWTSNGSYIAKDSYTPNAGDLIILDENNDGAADHAAIITEANGTAIKIVEGDLSDAVTQANYDTTDARVIGYIQLPQNPAMQTAEETTETEETAVPEETATAAPEETAQPETTAAPEAMEAAETAEPEATATPEVTATPEAASAPEATATAEATSTPEATASPEATATPEATPEAASKSSVIKRFMARIFKASATKTQDITNSLTNATITIDGQKVDGTTKWNVKAGQEYDLTLHFEESTGKQFPDDDTLMTYKIPDGLTVDDKDTTFDMVINKGTANEKTIHGNKMVVDKKSGLITLQWNTSDSNIDELRNANDAYIDVNIKGSFGSDKSQIKFSDSVTRDINVDTSHNASVSKSGYYDQKDGKIHYTVTVNSSGTSENIVVNDTITGTALTYDNNATYTSTNGATAIVSKVGNGFTATIPSMSNGETVTFTYTASVDLSKIKKSGSATEAEAGNGVKITADDDHNPDDNSTSNTVNNISFSNLSKNAKSVGDTYTEGDKTYKDVTWNIKANEERKTKITYISDSINADSQSIMTYSGDGLTIIVTKEDGTKETRNVKWTDSNIKKTATGWTYTPPTTDGKASYDVTYTTKVNITGLNADKTVQNNTSTDHNSSSGNAPVGPDAKDRLSASKSATKVTEDEVEWTITVNVPKTGYDKLIVTDTLPMIYEYSTNLYDSFEKIESVSGLDENESYVVDSASDPSKFTIKFYKDKDKKNPGVNSSTSNRTVTIRYTTKNNPKWMQYVADHSDASWERKHTNTVKITVPGIESGNITADAYPSKKTVKKTGAWAKNSFGYNDASDNWQWHAGDYKDSSGVIWRIYEYDIVLGGVTEDDIVLSDSFDTSLLQLFDGIDGDKTKDDAGVIFGGNSDKQEEGPKPITIQQTEDGIRISTDDLPRKSDGSLYGYYRIHYYLKAKISDLNQFAAKSGGTAIISNSVKWGTAGSKADVQYTYPGVKKELNFDWNTKTASYKITVNPSKAEMNGGQPMTLTDTFTHQTINYSTIKITATDNKGKDRSGDVSYEVNAAAGKLTFTIPDSTYVVITYDAKPSGTSGTSFKMTNTAELLTYSAETSQDVTMDASSGGGGSTTGLRLLKYEKGNMTTKLSGAVFQLLDASGNALKYDLDDKKGQNITFTTGSNGYVDIYPCKTSGFRAGLEKGKTYILREITAPEGYQKAEDIRFTISKDGSSDLSKNLYANGATLPVADKKITKVSITLKKVDSGNIEKSLQGAVFDLYGSGYAINTSAKAIKTNLTTGENGTVELETLESGTYYLVERQAPEGYGKEKDPIKLIVQDDNVTVDQGGKKKDFAISDDSGKQTAVITVTDDQAYNLPKTGGAGTTMIYLAGGVLVAVAVVMFVMQKRKRG